MRGRPVALTNQPCGLPQDRALCAATNNDLRAFLHTTAPLRITVRGVIPNPQRP